MRTLKVGSTGPDVEQLQQKLKQFGHYTGRIDGIFGTLTKNAVMNFQRVKGLVVDGIAGPITLGALGLGAATPTPQPGRSGALSLHIGVNRVDPAKYGGWNGALSGCENDARTMTDISRAEGFTSTQLFTQQATSQNVFNEIREAAENLQSGGIFFLTYAGHGGQVPNENADIEEDQQDETWVLYDRQVLDDEIEQAFTAFKPGVFIVMLSDSCHSGTVYRGMRDPVQEEIAALKRSFYTDLAMPRPGPDQREPVFSFPRPAARVGMREAPTPALAGVGPASRGEAPVQRFPGQHTRSRNGGMGGEDGGRGGPGDGGAGLMTRDLPLEANIIANEAQAGELYAAKQRSASRGPVQATGLLISGCQDAQLSQEVGGNGVFTTAVRHTWAANTFSGSYEAYHKQILSQMGPTQTPMLSGFGANPQELLRRVPFNPQD